MAFLLYIVGLVVFTAGLGWLFSALGVAPAVVNTGALLLLATGAIAGLTRVRVSNRA